MAQQYGAAQPIVDLAQRWSNTAENALNRVPSTDFRRKDTSWHDDMVREANESASKAQVAKPAVKKPVKRPTARTAAKRR